MKLKQPVHKVHSRVGIAVSLVASIVPSLSTSAATFTFQPADLYLNDFGQIDSDWINYANLGLSPAISLEDTLVFAATQPQGTTSQSSSQASVSVRSVVDDLQRLQWRGSASNTPTEVRTLPQVESSRIFQDIYEFEPTSPRRTLNANQPRNFVIFDDPFLSPRNSVAITSYPSNNLALPPSVSLPTQIGIGSVVSSTPLPSSISLPRAIGLNSVGFGNAPAAPTGPVAEPQQAAIANRGKSPEIEAMDSELAVKPKNELPQSVSGIGYGIRDFLIALDEFATLEPENELILMPTASLPTPVALKDDFVMPSAIVGKIQERVEFVTAEQQQIQQQVQKQLEDQQERWDEQREKNRQEAQRKLEQQRQQQQQQQERLAERRREIERRMQEQEQKRQEAINRQLARRK